MAWPDGVNHVGFKENRGYYSVMTDGVCSVTDLPRYWSRTTECATFPNCIMSNTYKMENYVENQDCSGRVCVDVWIVKQNDKGKSFHFHFCTWLVIVVDCYYHKGGYRCHLQLSLLCTNTSRVCGANRTINS